MAPKTATEDGSAGTGIKTNGSDGGATSVVRKVLDCCVGHHDQSLRDTSGTITSTITDPARVFDVIVYVDFDEKPRVIPAVSLGQYDIEELGFWGIETTKNGNQIITFSFEYEGEMYGIGIIVTDD